MGFIIIKLYTIWESICFTSLSSIRIVDIREIPGFFWGRDRRFVFTPPKKIEKHSGQKLPVALNTLRTNGKIRRAFGPALRIWVKLPPKNEGNVGSHGRNYFGNQAFGDHISGFQWFMCRNKADGPCFQFALKIAAFFRPTFANQPKPALQPTLEQ